MTVVNLLCPAGEVTKGPFSRNKADILCRIADNLRPADGSSCCSDYAACKLYQAVREKEMENKKIPRLEPRRQDF